MAGSWSFIAVSVLADPGLWFYKSLPSCVFCGDNQKGSSRQRGVLNGVGPFMTRTCPRGQSFSFPFGM